jgi:hypothetical protein
MCDLPLCVLNTSHMNYESALRHFKFNVAFFAYFNRDRKNVRVCDVLLFFLNL